MKIFAPNMKLVLLTDNVKKFNVLQKTRAQRALTRNSAGLVVLVLHVPALTTLATLELAAPSQQVSAEPNVQLLTTVASISNVIRKLDNVEPLPAKKTAIPQAALTILLASTQFVNFAQRTRNAAT